MRGREILFNCASGRGLVFAPNAGGANSVFWMNRLCAKEAAKIRQNFDRGRRIVLPDQLEFVMRRDAGIDEEVGDHGDQRRAEVDQERR